MSIVSYTEALDAFKALLDRFDRVDLNGKKIPYTSLNGHMTSFLDPEGQFCLRLSKPDMATFLELYPAPPVTQYGAVMREYVAVPADLLADRAALAEWFKNSRDYVGSLKPKPTKRP